MGTEITNARLPVRPSSQNLRVDHEIVPLKLKCKDFSRKFLRA